MDEKRVIVYSTPTCPWCKKVKQLLDANSIKYEDRNVMDDKVARDGLMNKTHQMAVPTTFINEDYVIGYNEVALKEKLGIK